MDKHSTYRVLDKNLLPAVSKKVEIDTNTPVAIVRSSLLMHSTYHSDPGFDSQRQNCANEQESRQIYLWEHTTDGLVRALRVQCSFFSTLFLGHNSPSQVLLFAKPALADQGLEDTQMFGVWHTSITSSLAIESDMTGAKRSSGVLVAYPFIPILCQILFATIAVIEVFDASLFYLFSKVIHQTILGFKASLLFI